MDLVLRWLNFAVNLQTPCAKPTCTSDASQGSHIKQHGDKGNQHVYILKIFYLYIHISEETNWINTNLKNCINLGKIIPGTCRISLHNTSATGHHWDVGEWKAWSCDVMYTHKKAHKWVWRDWWDFKKLLEGISLGLFPTAPQCQSQSRRKDGRRKGREKKHTTIAAA